MAAFEGVPGMQMQSVPAGAYTKLLPDQLERAMQFGVPRTYTSTTRLYRQGEREADFYIVLTGMVQTFWVDAVEQQEHSLPWRRVNSVES